MQRPRRGQLEVSAVGLGCGTMTPFYGEPDRAAGIATIRRAREIGVDLLDTADGYGRGRNEELVAEAVREHRGDYVIASKFGNLGLLGDPRFADGRPEYVHETCEKSLGRLRTDVIDLYYIHRVDPTVPRGAASSVCPIWQRLRCCSYPLPVIKFRTLQKLNKQSWQSSV